MNNLIENYNKALQDLYDHVDFVEDWVVYAVDDRTGMFWYIYSDEVYYAENIEEFNKEDGMYYADEIYTQRFYDKHIYKGKDLTMIFVDTHTYGNKFFAFFDNNKEIDPIYMEE